MIFLGGVIMAIVGLTGTLTKIVDFIGEDIASGMMAGVGLILAKTAVDMIKADKLSGFVSLVSALITYYIFRDSSNVLVYTILISVVASCVAAALFQKGEKKTIKVEDDNFKRQKFTFNTNVIIGALGMACLNIGSNISFGSITSAMAPDAHYNVDQLTFISSVADMCSSFFGGAPVESIISATAAAPHAVICGIVMMVVIGVILLTGLLPKIGRYVPSSSIAGFLFVLGVFKTVCLDAPTALATAPAVGGLTMAVTAISNPFFGMLAGIAARLLGL
jgi:AGZA family xanthine/uracil permease-like MFS transporter